MTEQHSFGVFVWYTLEANEHGTENIIRAKR